MSSTASSSSSLTPAATAAASSSHSAMSTAATPIIVHGSARLSYTGVTAVVTEPQMSGIEVNGSAHRVGCTSAIMLPIARYW